MKYKVRGGKVRNWGYRFGFYLGVGRLLSKKDVLNKYVGIVGVGG